MALSLLMAGGLEVLQTASIVAAFPFAIIMFLSMFSLAKSLRSENTSVEFDKEGVME